MPSKERRSHRAARVATIVRIAALTVPLLGVVACSARTPTHVLRKSADHHYAMGRVELAAEQYTLITEQYPGDWRGQHRVGQCALELGQLSKARRALEIAHVLRPHDIEIVDALAEVMYRQDDETALFAFLRHQTETTGSVVAYRRLARYAMAMGDPDSAKIALETAIRLNQGHTVEPYLEAASFARRVGNLDLAIRRLRQAYTISPRDERVNEQLIALGEVPGPTIALPLDR